MTERPEFEKPETIEAILLHDQLQEMFTQHTAVIISKDYMLAVLSGTVQLPTESGLECNDEMTVINHMRDGVPTYVILQAYNGSEEDVDSITVTLGNAKYNEENSPSLDVEEIQTLRALLRFTRIDNKSAESTKEKIEALGLFQD